MQQFKQSEATATYRRIYMFLANPADGYTPVTTLVGATVNLFKNGVAFGSQPTTPATLVHIQSGHWYYEMNASFLSDLGILTVTVQDTNIRPVVLMAQVVAFDPTASTGISAADVWSYVTRDLTGSVAVASIANNAITAASINADAITAAKIATGAIDADAIAADAITSAKIADSAITIRLVTDATPSEARIETGAVAADVYNALLASYTTANTFGARLVRTIASPVTNEVSINASNHIAANVHQMQNNTITAAAIATDAIDADAIATDASNEIADALLNRNIGGGSSTGRLVKEGLFALRNKSEIVGATLNVYDESDALSWTAAVASSASADPVTGIDP